MSDTTSRRRLPHFGIKTSSVLLALAAIVCAVVVNWEYVPGTYYRDGRGFPHGTGWAYNYAYKDGGLMAKEYYRAGELIEQIWFKPDGGIFAISTFHRDGVNVGYYLRETALFVLWFNIDIAIRIACTLQMERLVVTDPMVRLTTSKNIEMVN